jgi:hypothetical protein
MAQMRILWFNCRDIQNPAAGGAQVYTFKVMKILTERGHKMILFPSRFKDYH